VNHGSEPMWDEEYGAPRRGSRHGSVFRKARVLENTGEFRTDSLRRRDAFAWQESDNEAVRLIGQARQQLFIILHPILNHVT